MTQKRFTYEYDEHNGTLFDNKMNTFYQIEDNDENIEILCDRLNWLVEENEELKSKNRGLQSELQIFKEDVTHSNLQINKLADENEQLKFKLEEVKSDEKQLGISFMEFKMKLIEKLQIHYDYATEQRQRNLNDIFVAKAYDIIRYDINKLAEEMGVDLE